MLCERHTLVTQKTMQFLSITRQIEETMAKSAVSDGLCVVFVPHTTAGVTINENADPDVVYDLTNEINKIVPFADQYRHGEGNSAAHLKSSLFGSSLTLVIQGGRLLLGTWQTVYFVECDGPRTRYFYVKTIAG
jgi:secondary thiamine-phosphate synthase enzyme